MSLFGYCANVTRLFAQCADVFIACANDSAYTQTTKLVCSRFRGRVSVFTVSMPFFTNWKSNNRFPRILLVAKINSAREQTIPCQKSKFAFYALCACAAPTLIYTKCSPAHAQTIPRAKSKIWFFDPLRMRNSEISGCAQLLMRWAIDSKIVIFHFLIPGYAHARPKITTRAL